MRGTISLTMEHGKVEIGTEILLRIGRDLGKVLNGCCATYQRLFSFARAYGPDLLATIRLASSATSGEVRRLPQGDSFTSTFENPQSFGVLGTATPFPKILLTVLASCSREDRILSQPPPQMTRSTQYRSAGLNPGANLIPTPPSSHMYEENAYAVSEGQKLYESYNCVGCHAHGGSGIGPPLMDRNWLRP